MGPGSHTGQPGGWWFPWGSTARPPGISTSGRYRKIGDRHGEAGVLGNIGVVEWWQGRYQQAAAHLRQSLAISRDLGDRRGQARILGNLGVVEWWQGRYEEFSPRTTARPARFSVT